MKTKNELRRIREAKCLYGTELLSHPDVHGIGIGYAYKKGKKTKKLSLVVHVHKKRPLKEVDVSRRLPASLSFFSEKEKAKINVRIDVREVLPPKPEVICGDCSTDFETRVRPVPGGFSFGLAGVAGGTMGGYVWDDDTEQIVFLSNEHVLGSTAGSTVVQPSATDGGVSPADDFGQVLRSGTLDAAIGTVNDSDDVKIEIECSGPAVYEIAEATIDMQIEKVGQTTGLTCGIVELIDYDSAHYGFHNDLWIDGDGSDFSQGGDSGSLYVEKEPPADQDWKRVVGIHWGGSGNDGVGHPISAVFNDLNLTTVCAGVVSQLIEAIFGANETETEKEESQAYQISTARLAKYYPGPITKKGNKISFYHGFERDFEKRIQKSRVGAQVLKAIRNNRTDVVNFLLNGDGWRSTVVALAPILSGKVTTDEVLKHRFSETDIDNFQRVIEVSARLRPGIKPLLNIAKKLLMRAEGRTLSSVIFGSSKK